MKHSELIDTLFAYTVSLPYVARAKVGAIIVYKKRIIAFGRNRYKTHPLQARYGRNEQSIFLHAEIDAIRQAISFDLSNTSLLVLRVKRSFPTGPFHMGNSKPCSGCMRAIAAFGIKDVWWSE